ncbi:MAG: aldo/keto reductase [Anaerolineae bacterium]|jgi:L-galactose dehydrogenase|nr:aldo/keto reductase [Chloroflexota bacterium]
MLYRTLGRTGLQVSLVGLGTGGPSQLGQSTGRSADESYAVVRAALDLGINILDTSPAYRSSEQLLGEALVGVPRDRYILATKFNPGRVAPDAGPDAFTAQLEDSLRYLRTDYIDVLQYHGVAPDAYRSIIDRFHPAALRAQEQGKIGYIGITETMGTDVRHEMLEMALQEDLFDTFMVHYGILNQLAENRVYPLAQARNVGVFVMGPVRMSLRTPEEAVARLTYFIQQGWLDIPIPSAEDPLGMAHVSEPTRDLTRVAYRFAAAHPAVSTMLVGTGNPEHLRHNVEDVLSGTLSEDELAYLRHTYGTLAWHQ